MIASALALVLTACTNPQPPQADMNDKPLRDRLFGVGPINHETTRSGEGVRYNFEMNQDPQSIRNLSDVQYSISDDQDKIRHLVQSEKGMDPSMVAIIGDRAYIHVNTSQKMKKREANIKELRAKLETAMPRYEIRLKVADK